MTLKTFLCRDMAPTLVFLADSKRWVHVRPTNPPASSKRHELPLCDHAESGSHCRKGHQMRAVCSVPDPVLCVQHPDQLRVPFEDVFVNKTPVGATQCIYFDAANCLCFAWQPSDATALCAHFFGGFDAAFLLIPLPWHVYDMGFVIVIVFGHLSHLKWRRRGHAVADFVGALRVLIFARGVA